MTHDELVIRRGNASGQTGSLPPAKAIKVNESKMTHDELLKLILDSEIRSNEVGQGGWQALRAVVELLKGYDDGQTLVNEEFNQGILALSNVIKEAIEEKL